MMKVAIAQAVAHPAIEDPWEYQIYWSHVRSADAGLAALSKADMVAILDCSDSMITEVEARMAGKGWIFVESFQKGRRITIMATGKSTAAPKCTSPHWRTHKTDPFTLLRMRHPDQAQQVLVVARREGSSPAALMAELIREGLEARGKAA
jgi:hypothetical protein